MCMSNGEIARRIMSERLRLLANMCQTLAVGILLLGIAAPLLQTQGAAGGLSGLEAISATVFALALLLTPHKLTGEAIRIEP